MMTFFDSHMHIIDPKFPLVENQGYVPEPFTFADYQRRTSNFNVIGGAIVSGSFQLYDTTYLENALSLLGSGFVGVINLKPSTSDEDIVNLHQQGVRAIRLNVKRGGYGQLKDLDYLAKRVYELVGWHVEMYIDSKSLSDIAATVRNLPAVSIDHLGLSQEGFDVLLSLVEKGVMVKATGFGRVDFNVREAIRSLVSANPSALMFGTDLPCPRVNRPFQNTDLDILLDALGDSNLAEKVLYRNALRWYGIDTASHSNQKSVPY
jgi:predicted TIM-barrel fold metal-dependent hydrolase